MSRPSKNCPSAIARKKRREQNRQALADLGLTPQTARDEIQATFPWRDIKTEYPRIRRKRPPLPQLLLYDRSGEMVFDHPYDKKMIERYRGRSVGPLPSEVEESQPSV